MSTALWRRSAAVAGAALLLAPSAAGGDSSTSGSDEAWDLTVNAVQAGGGTSPTTRSCSPAL